MRCAAFLLRIVAGLAPAAHPSPPIVHRSRSETGFHSNDVSFHVINAAAAAHLRGNIADESAER